jgi:L-lysine 2,3-aminomutase
MGYCSLTSRSGVKRMTKPAADNNNSGHETPPPSDLNWRTAMSRAFSCADELLATLQIAPNNSIPIRTFPLRVPRSFVSRMQPGDPDDPLLRQVLPIPDELCAVDGYSTDPVGDLDSAIAPGVLHKYAGRAMLVVT